MPNYGFPQSKRLLKPEDFRKVFTNSAYKVYCSGFVFLATPNNLSSPRLGFVMAKKNIKLAVQRNKYKRLLRESFRLNQHSLPGIDIVVLALKSCQETTPLNLVPSLTPAWLKLSKQANKAAKQSFST